MWNFDLMRWFRNPSQGIPQRLPIPFRSMTADNCSHSVQSKGNPLFVNSSSSSLGPTIFCSESELRIFESRDTKKYCILNSLYISERWLQHLYHINSNIHSVVDGASDPWESSGGSALVPPPPACWGKSGQGGQCDNCAIGRVGWKLTALPRPPEGPPPRWWEGLCKAINFHSILPSAGRVHPLNVSSLDVFIS